MRAFYKIFTLVFCFITLAGCVNEKADANELIYRHAYPLSGKPDVIGGYAAGCMAGAQKMPSDGQGWQMMRLSRNRYWGHPELIDFLKRLGDRSVKEIGENGILIGDMAQPRGGPMRGGHASHQSGLDADVWLSFAPDRIFTPREREETSAISLVTPNMTIRDSYQKQKQGELILKAAEDPRVSRIFVNAAIKKQLCNDFGSDDLRLRKIRPWFGHDYHMHVRLNCPTDAAGCENQPPPPPGSGCKGNDLEWWFSAEARTPKPPAPKTAEPAPDLLSKLPAQCRAVFATP